MNSLDDYGQEAFVPAAAEGEVSPMLEKAALAIYRQAWGASADKRWHNDKQGRAHFVKQARAALTAIREPTDDGLFCAASALELEWIKTHPGQEVPFPIGYNNVRAGHRAMIDAILSGSSGNAPAPTEGMKRSGISPETSMQEVKP